MLIRNAELGDACWISALRQDPVVIKNLHNPQTFPAYKVVDWLKNLPSSSIRLIAENETIATKSGIGPIYPMNLIGLFRVDHIDQINKNCYVGLDIHESYRGKGLAKIIYNRVLYDLFNNHGMHRIYLEVIKFNEIALSLYEKIGFKQTGIFPEKVFRDGKWHDSIIMSLDKVSFGI